MLGFSVSCSDGTYFLPDSARAEEVRLRTVDDGEFVISGDELSLEIELGDESDFDGATVSVRTAEGSEVAFFEWIRDDFGAERRVTIPTDDLDPGLYTLDISVESGGRELLREERRAFVVGREFHLDGLRTYPARVHPAAVGVFQTSARGPEEAWLQWSVDGEIVAAGPIGDGLEELEWHAPDREGVYRVKVELFPVPPPSGDRFDFPSGLAEGADVYVSRSLSNAAEDSRDRESYYSLYRLKGDLRDDGVRIDFDSSRHFDGRPFGETVFRVEGDMFGYQLDGSSGFESDGLGVPFVDSSLAPFSLSLALLPFGEQSARTVYRTATADGSFEFRVETDNAGIPRAMLRRNGEEDTTSSAYPMLVPNEPSRISVSVSPGVEYTTVLWFVDGQLASIDQLDIGFPSSPLGDSPTSGARTRVVTEPGDVSVRDGVTTVGAETDGFSGLVGEVGVYFRDSQERLSTDDGLFRDAMESRFASRLAYAQGFEGLFLPEELETVGRVTVRTGELVLEPGSRVHFPAFLFEDEDLIVELELGDGASEAAGEFVFDESYPEDDGHRLFTMISDGSALIGDATYDTFASDGVSTLLLRIRHDDDRLIVRGGAGAEEEIPLGGSEFDGVTMTARHEEEREIPLRVLSVLAHRDRVGLAERLDFSGSQ